MPEPADVVTPDPTSLRPSVVPGLTVGGVRVSGVTVSSLQVVPGDLYAALPGRRTHGANYAAEAVAAGAVAVLTDPAGAALVGDLPVPVLVDPEPRRRMAVLAAEAYGRPAERMRMFAITGTNGKTTTAYVLAAALEQLGHRVGTVGTLGFALDGVLLPSSRTTVTTPEAPDLQALFAVFAERGADTLVMEASSHALALGRVEPTRFDVTAFTNLGWDHRDFHPTQTDYFEAKAKLFLPERTKAAVISVDDEWGVRLAERVRAAGLPLVTTSLDGRPGADVTATWRPVPAGSVATVTSAAGTAEVLLSLPGEHNVRNLLTAVGMLQAAGLDVAVALPGFAHVTVPGRMQRVRLPAGAPAVYVDFAHTPQAVAAALAAVNGGQGRTIVVLGCGGDRDSAKRGPMGRVAVEGADVLVATDDNPRTEDPEAIRAAMLAGAYEARTGAAEGSRAAHCDIIDGGDRRAAIATALSLAGPDDVVAVLGKGHETGQDLGDHTVPFSDADVVIDEYDRRRAVGL